MELVDLYPTLAELCNLPVPEGLEGTSFVPLLNDPDLPWKSAVFSEAKRNGAHGRTVRTANYRYTEWSPLDGSGATQHELYDLASDPREFVNLAKSPEHADIREHLSEKLRAGWRAALPAIGRETGDPN
ncbi:MAG: DUF4976 domain-containing protein [Bryobacterales bacterium]|nr:DUF4976 domain-containing protein [Bryobacterales bacterium]